MPEQSTHGLIAKAPKPLLEREVKLDLKALGKALVGGGTEALKGDWYGAARCLSEGFIDGLGLRADVAGVLAWRLVLTALRRAVLGLVEEHPLLPPHEPNLAEALPDEIALLLAETELRVDETLLTASWRLPLLMALEPAFARWLIAFGADKDQANAIATQLPRRFGLCLWDEWAAHPDTYRPLFDAVMAPIQRPPDLDGLRQAYLDYLSDSYRYLDLKGLPGFVEAVEKAAGLELGKVYTAIHARIDRPAGDTWDRSLREARNAPAVEGSADRIKALAPAIAGAADRPTNPRSFEPLPPAFPALVLLGDPGAGKSTLLKHLALTAIRDELAPLPILVPLSAYAEALRKQPRPLRTFLAAYQATRRASLGDLAPLFEHAIERGRALVLLDGLDEVQTDRGALVKRVEDLVREIVPAVDADPRRSPIPPGNRVLVTSRFVGYREHPLADPRWLTLAVCDWDRDGISDFATRWTRAVELAIAGGHETPEVIARAEQERDELLASIFANPKIEQLAGNPLLATILALIKRQGVTLPQRRVELYELYLKTLLESWRKARNLDRSPIGPDVDYLELLEVLQPLALWLRDENPEAGLIHREALMDWLWDWYEREEGLNRHEAKEAARRFLDSVHRYSSLLLEKGPDRFGFLHLTFEEYLAAKALARLPPEEAVSRVRANPEDSRWRETFLLAVGALGIVRQSPEQAGALLEQLVADEPSRVHASKANCKLAAARAYLAYDALGDVGVVGAGRRGVRRVSEALARTMKSSWLPPQERRRAGLLLGDLGWVPDDLDAWVEIPPGPFLYGESNKSREIPHRYWIGKYPVTNLQFARFIAADGYARWELWSDAGWAWRETQGIAEPAYWHDGERSSPLCSVVGVSWYEAEAYCRWMTREGFGQASAGGGPPDLETPSGWIIRLPTGLEWERAARGTDGRVYPWGDDEPRPDLANYDGLTGGTTAVGAYPAGCADGGIADLAGNVWEWSADTDGAFRFFRGGSWGGDVRDCRSAYRGAGLPGGRRGYVGFRCARAQP
jgi:formylglycine-generating enzyme required for sulfatase activity/energy-coupling factor transporter ATP-binding protein EcfA2